MTNVIYPRIPEKNCSLEVCIISKITTKHDQHSPNRRRIFICVCTVLVCIWFQFCLSNGLTSVTTLLSPTNVLLGSTSLLEMEQYAFSVHEYSIYWKRGIFCYDNFPGQTESNNKHLFYFWSPQQEDVCQNCGCEKHFLRKGYGYNHKFDCIL